MIVAFPGQTRTILFYGIKKIAKKKILEYIFLLESKSMIE